MEKTMKQTKAYMLLEKKKSLFLSHVNDAITYAEKMLPLINNVFSAYTIHGINHAVNVAEHMYDLIDDVEKLSELELVMLIYAALFHDTGMISSDTEIRQIKGDQLLLGDRKYSEVLRKFKNENIALQECIRPIHGLRSKIYIESIDVENRKMFLIPETTNISFQKEIALVCQAHDEDFSWLVANLKADMIKENYRLNAQYVAILLRLGDYLDIDEQRAPLYLYKYLNPQDYGDLEWQKHFNIENYDKVYLNEKTGLKEIVFQGQSENPTVHRKLLKYFDSINDELLDAVGLCEKYENRIYLLNLKTHIINKLNTTGFTFSDFRLALDYNAVTNLLMGEHIYGDKKYGLREIIQNSIDACKTMQETAESHLDFILQTYEPFISIMIDKDRHRVTILDNGSGMSIDILKKYFLNVGVSYYKSDDYVLQGRKYSPIGHYGIGFLACFMLSDKVEVKTRHIKENRMTKIEFEKNSEYICLTYEDKYKTQGTEITLDYEQFMKVFNNNDKEVVKFIESNFLDCDIPIKIIFQENGQTEVQICQLEKIEKILSETICLNQYLEGIEAYIECNYKQINFASSLENLNGYKSYYYDSVENLMIEESNCGLCITDFVKNGEVRCISIPIIYFNKEEDFKKAFEVLGDFSQALDKIDDYDMINILPKDLNEPLIEQIIEKSDDEIIGYYTLEKFRNEFQHSEDIPAHTFKEEFNVISNGVEKVLPYIKRVNFGGRYVFDQKDKVYIKNVLLSRLKITIPFLVDGIRLKNAVVNITNNNFFPNVSRDNINNEMQEMLSYAIGKALHLWILDNVSFASDERKLLEDFIAHCYSTENFCIK